MQALKIWSRNRYSRQMRRHCKVALNYFCEFAGVRKSRLSWHSHACKVSISSKQSNHNGLLMLSVVNEYIPSSHSHIYWSIIFLPFFLSCPCVGSISHGAIFTPLVHILTVYVIPYWLCFSQGCYLCCLERTFIYIPCPWNGWRVNSGTYWNTALWFSYLLVACLLMMRAFPNNQATSGMSNN